MIPDGYISGLGRDYPHPRLSHLYKGTFSDPGLPMCRRGWNRAQGSEYSIWRGNIGAAGICLICLKRAWAGKEGVEAREYRPSVLLDDAQSRQFIKDIKSVGR